ncbi:VWA domain-containing protein [Cupriavidus sp. BIC8F]|uniref:vWA domain-containing protein n=1 Tax=Cupriavidus sp. BIC8F TaxID=3079014 RepID=UPI0029160FFE|nr:VWA domain-containing protein [Cupriavidus sp. BIC8F]
MTRKPVRRQQGQITIIVGVLMLGLVGIAGLGIDAGMAYIVKAKLNAAVDSAAVAAARAVTNGATRADQTANARQAASEFFNANFKTGFLKSTASLNPVSVDFDTPTPGAVTLGVSASATMPLTLMKVLGFSNVAVAATSQTIRKDLDLIFVIDSSGSMGPVWSTVKSNANSFLDQFSPTSDRVGLVHFSAGAVSDIAINTVQRGFNRTAMKTKISGLSSNGTTNYAEGLYQARVQLDSILQANRSSLRVVVFFSDGEPNTLAATYNMGTRTDVTTTTRVYTCAKNQTSNCPYTETKNTTSNTVNANKTCAGGASGTSDPPSGLYEPNQQSKPMSNPCATSSNNSSSGNLGNGKKSGSFTQKDTTVYYGPTAMPATYDVRQETDPALKFKIVGSQATTGSGLPVDATFSTQNLMNASTNVALEMATYLRQHNVYIFTLGLDGNGGFNEDLLKNMANTSDAKLYKSDQPSGVYCYAKTIDDLKPCFSKLASEILRISK